MLVILLPCFSITTCVKNLQLRKEVLKQVILKKCKTKNKQKNPKNLPYFRPFLPSFSFYGIIMWYL